MKRILITGVDGQIGSELFEKLRRDKGVDHVVGLDVRPPDRPYWKDTGHFEIQDATDRDGMQQVIEKYDVDTVFHMTGILSAKGENHPELAWHVNINSLKSLLDLARTYKLKIFWPSSIAVFGPSAQKTNTPQIGPLDPTTIYGTSKVAGELLANYYFIRYGIDTRSVRFPGLISYGTPPGGGTTDYAVDMFYYAMREKPYPCFVSEETMLPMMYMPDAIKSMLDIMKAPAENIRMRTSYNLTAMSFPARDLELEIKKHFPDFYCEYKPDYRQKIADSWPNSIDDSKAQNDWNWHPDFDLTSMVEDMILNLKPLLLNHEKA